MSPPRPEMCLTDVAVVAAMIELIPAQTDEKIREYYGISWNTWMRLKRGRPIRRSTAERLLARVERRQRLPTDRPAIRPAAAA